MITKMKYGFDFDTFKFTLSNPGYVNIVFEHNMSVGYWSIVLRNSELKGIATISSETNQTRVTGYDLGLPAGTYYLDVHGLPNSSNVSADYKFKIIYKAANNWETELNDTTLTADNLTLGQTMIGSTVATTVSPYSLIDASYYDNDYYKFTLSKKTKLQVSFSHDFTGKQYNFWDLHIYDMNLNEVFKITDLNNLSTKKNVTLPAGTYFLKVSAYDDETGFQYKLKVSIAAPTNVKAKSNSYNSNKITWNKVTGAKKYVVYRATSKNGKYKKVGTTTKTSYIDKKLTTGKKYYYKVKTSSSGAGTSGYSKVDNSKPSLKTTKISLSTKKSKATIKWNKVSGSSGYEVYMSTSKNSGYKKIKTTTKTSFTKTKLKSKKKYYFKVRAYRIVNGKKIYSSYSSVKKITVK